MYIRDETTTMTNWYLFLTNTAVTYTTSCDVHGTCGKYLVIKSRPCSHCSQPVVGHFFTSGALGCSNSPQWREHNSIRLNSERASPFNLATSRRQLQANRRCLRPVISPVKHHRVWQRRRQVIALSLWRTESQPIVAGRRDYCASGDINPGLLRVRGSDAVSQKSVSVCF